MSHYISITEAERAEMLKAVGVADTADMFVDVPATKRFPQLNLPAPLS
ncbi:MAG: glycine dehydrogenase, partial [Oscillochloris sp.]|nr:glycine dehydrogenase [Oscillochloris sp.]